MTKQEPCTSYAIFALLTATLGSFLFGFQTAVISGALSFLEKEFAMSSSGEGIAVSIILLGAIFGVVFAGKIADCYGRKKAILLPSILFTLGTVIVCSSGGLYSFMVGRFITGLAVGLISMTAPLYIAEIAPARLRGAFVCVHQLVVTMGILSAYLVNYAFADEASWRSMFMVGLIPSVLQFFLLLMVCESPSWLFSQGLKEKADLALQKLRGNTSSHMHHLPPVISANYKEKQTLASLFSKPKIRYVLIIGIVLNMFQQITGINTVIYYAPKIFAEAGFQTVDIAILAAIGLGIINVLSTGLSVWLIDRMGRRKLLFLGLSGMLVSLQLLAVVLFLKNEHTAALSVVALMGYIAFFAIGIGPVTFVLISEIYPLKIRGRAMGLAATSNWIFNFALSLVFLDLMKLMGSSGVFELFAVLTLACLVFVYYCIPETKGKSLEEIEAGLQ
ncbi:MAG: sugar porter family MFS transporter [Chlamydiae bacterium]|nr:sugar porter family MFS transporter [Chlamydiota bacterium]